ncbi:MAG: hypothetical protein V1847_00140 [Candidatus Diapherotrites archaeon]
MAKKKESEMVGKKEATGTESSVIEVIQKMVSEGESEEKIIQTLQELGVESDKAKRLLLLGQADTFALLRGEIARIVEGEVGKELPKLAQYIEEEAETVSQRVKTKITSEVKAEIDEYEKAITGQSKTFQQQMNDTVQKVAELGDRVKDKLNEQGVAVTQLRQEMDEVKLRGIGRNKWLGIGLILIGVLFVLADLALIALKFLPENAILSPDTLAVIIVVALIGITMIFAGSTV